MAIREMVATETKYVENLKKILTIFLPALKTVVSPKTLNRLFPAQLKQLVEHHEEILNDMKNSLNSESEYYGFVGDIFSRLYKYWNVSHYC